VGQDAIALSVKKRLRLPAARLLSLRLRASGRKRGLAIAYHGIEDSAERDPLGLTLDAGIFEMQVRYLQAHYRLVHGSELLGAVRARQRGEPFPVAITFDDDLRTHLSTAKPILDRCDAPATFFLGGTSLDRPWTFWWERLERAFAAGLVGEAELRELVPPREGRGPIDSRGLKKIATDIESIEPDDRDALSALLGARLGPDPEDAGLRRSDIHALSADGRYEIGFHTRSHYNLTILDDAQLAEELTVGRAEVEAAAGQALRSIAFPGGRWNGRVLDAARAAGYVRGFTCDPVPAVSESDPLRVGRLVPGWCVTLDEFAIAVAYAMAGHYPAWPAVSDRPIPIQAPRLRPAAESTLMETAEQ
jgi:peptidoglycan/xylan/chitin deacetylase (PgdA/CDA1 family)